MSRMLEENDGDSERGSEIDVAYERRSECANGISYTGQNSLYESRLGAHKPSGKCSLQASRSVGFLFRHADEARAVFDVAHGASNSGDASCTKRFRAAALL